MPSKRKSLLRSKLYLILDAQVNSYAKLFEIAREAVNAGVDIIQLRDKNGSTREILTFSRRLVRLCRGKTIFIVNDRADIASAAKADGVHLGQEDLLVKYARKILGKKAIIGISCQDFWAAKIAQSEGADYIGFGSVFKTLTKPGRKPMDLKLLKKVFGAIKIPVFAIGGIDLKGAHKLKALGIDRLAVCRSICLANNISRRVKEFERILRGGIF